MQFHVGEINVICSDAERSLRFYRDILGFEMVEEETGAFRMRCGATTFLLLPYAGPSPPRPPYCSIPEFSIDLMVDDIQAAHNRFAEFGAEFASHWKPGDRSFHLRDPDGLVFEVIARAQD